MLSFQMYLLVKGQYLNSIKSIGYLGCESSERQEALNSVCHQPVFIDFQNFKSRVWWMQLKILDYFYIEELKKFFEHGCFIWSKSQPDVDCQ
jgi:hypothetical protein